MMKLGDTDTIRNLPTPAKLQVLKRLQSLKPEEWTADNTDFTRYANDPIGFCEKFFGESYTDDVKAMMESVRVNPVTIAKSANATGKTHASARIAVWWYLCHEECQVYTSAAPPEGNLKKLLWGEIGSLTEKHPELLKESTIKSLHIERSAQVFLTGVTIPLSGSDSEREAKFSGKHSPNLLFIIDEGDAVPDEIYRGIESCMSGGRARLLVMFNPRAEAGEVFRMERDGNANVVSLSAFRHPNVTSGEDLIPGAVTRDTVVRRINEWCRPLQENEEQDRECFELPEFLVGTVAKSRAGTDYPPLKAGWYKVVESAFFYMVLGIYPLLGSAQLISREWIQAARRRWLEYVQQHGEVSHGAGIMGLDVAEMGTDGNCLCDRICDFVKPLKVWTGMDIIATSERALDEFSQSAAIRVNTDGNGVGAGVAPYLNRKGVLAYGVKVQESPTIKCELGEFRILRDQLWWSMREWLKSDTAMLPPDDLLEQELMTPTYSVEGKYIRVMAKPIMKDLLKRSPDRAEALCLTFFQPDRLFPELN